ncbi:MAG: B12-binding domain-containing radical SAM protein [Candidatus Omnitrophica bacterium]|nr:B12-binding domain-containing radical SAM protein [Candidatus Omnitrophota bacterium]
MLNIKGRVLFLYPNTEGDGGIPNGLALLSGGLKAAGFETACFDTTFLKAPPKTHLYRQKHGGVLKADHLKYWGDYWDPTVPEKIPELFKKAVDDFRPDLIAVTIIDVSYKFVVALLGEFRKTVKVPVIAGGPTVTMCPDMVINNDGIDIVCVGEGEDPLVELAESLVEGRDHAAIKNLWVKKEGKIIKNPLRPLKDMATLSFQDWSIFDKRHYYKPYCGSFFRTGFFELARGCPFNCTFCCTASLKELYEKKGDFLRFRDIDRTMDEVSMVKDRYGLELVFFIDDNFLGMPPERFDLFCERYKSRIGLPFYIQTRPETISEGYIKKLKDANVSSIGIGIENGNVELRKTHMRRYMSNEKIIEAFDIVHKHGIRTTANIIIGMPYEKECMFRETIDLLRKIRPKSISINYFQPYRGTEMRKMAVDLGYIPEDHIIGDSNTCIDMPDFRKDRQIHFYENFKKYLDGEIPLD